MSNYSTSFHSDKIITRRTAFQYAQMNTRIPFYVEGIAAEAFQKKSVIQTIQHQTVLCGIPWERPPPDDSQECLFQMQQSGVCLSPA